MNKEELQKQIAALQAQLANCDDEAYRRPCRITACVPCGPYALLTAWRAILALEPGHQSEPVRLHVTAAESAPPEAAALQAASVVFGKRVIQVGADRIQSFVDYQFVGVVPNQRNRLANICEARRMLSSSVNTEYLLWIDSDVVIPPGGIARLVGEMDKNEKLAWLSIPYSMGELDHPQNGCTLARTELMKRLTWSPKRCSCHSACQELKAMGYEVANVKDMTAQHIKLER